MKNYDPAIAAQKIVWLNTKHGLSRHKNPILAKSFVTSVLTEKAHISALTGYSKWLHLTSGKHLKNSNISNAEQYILERSKCRKQSTINLDRQAINLHLHPTEPISFVTAEIPTVPKNRAYSQCQIDLLVEHADDELALSILLASAAGLRDMELITISDQQHLQKSIRNWHPERFKGIKDSILFVVHGKGGLNREVSLPNILAGQLESRRLPSPSRVLYRKAHLLSYFEIINGQRFSSDFGKHSTKILGFSHGAHGLRHSYAQRRRNELIALGFSPEESIRIVSQELGHFSIKNTLAYMRDMC